MSCPRWDIIDDKLLYEAWASDQDMYPASELTYDRLKSLNDACPELSICLRGTQREAQTGATGDKTSNTLNVSEPDASVTHGLIIVWPLRADMYWKQLLDHTIEEHDVEAAMFPPFCGGVVGEKIPVGLHIFHIERFSAFERPRKGVGFTTMALEEVRQRIAKLERTKAWCIVGYSALVATPEGSSAFSQLGFQPQGLSRERHDNVEFSPILVKLEGNEPFLPLR